jgi:hypothetical protein
VPVRGTLLFRTYNLAWFYGVMMGIRDLISIFKFRGPVLLMKAHLLGLQNVMELFFLNCNS